MDISLQSLKDNLRQVSEQYHAVVRSARFDYKNWRENVKLLSPIILKLREQAESRVNLCEKEITVNNDKQVIALDKRSALYSKLNTEKAKLSSLDLERIGIVKDIALLSQEISDQNNEIARLQAKIEAARKENEYWNTVFLATCWIPFANIGTGVKKHVEDGQYYAAIKVCGKAIGDKQSRINTLNERLQSVVLKQAQNKESSGKLANQITAVEGEVAEITNLINDLRGKMQLWQTVLIACMEIDTRLQYADGKIEVVMESFEHLLEVESLLTLPTTDKYIAGCVCKGDRLTVGQKLCQNEYLLSQNRRFAAVMQQDNNFVVYSSEGQLWASGTYGTQGNGRVAFGADGLVSLTGLNCIWNTKRGGAAALIMQDDGNLVTYDTNNKSLWSSDTYTYANAPSICFNKH